MLNFLSSSQPGETAFCSLSFKAEGKNDFEIPINKHTNKEITATVFPF